MSAIGWIVFFAYLINKWSDKKPFASYRWGKINKKSFRKAFSKKHELPFK